MEYFVIPVDEKGTCIKGFCPTRCRTMGGAVTTAVQLHKDLIKHQVEYDQVIIAKKK